MCDCFLTGLHFGHLVITQFIAFSDIKVRVWFGFDFLEQEMLLSIVCYVNSQLVCEYLQHVVCQLKIHIFYGLISFTICLSIESSELSD